MSSDEETWLALVTGVRDYVRKCGFSQVLLGLSGGIDSAVTAAIAVEALGAANVLGVLMPSPYSSRGSVEDSRKLAAQLGMQTTMVSIQGLMEAFDLALQKQFAGRPPNLAEENIQARIRGTLLMAISNKYGSLLLTTGNKSELAVGYCTLYGDMNGGLAVISDLYKGQVYSLARWINRDREIIPQAILVKAPSAELRPGQKDQDSLPPYDVLDQILVRLIERHESYGDIVAAGLSADAVSQTIRLVQRAEFKRRQAAPGLKVSQQAFGTGWRLPIAANLPCEWAGERSRAQVG
jgi:NAD+ synthase/NAD+ synthase (glutamine-hydrolysing)